jgi:N-acyl homoserine lactone hydrolase
MNAEITPFHHELLGDVQVLLPGVPCRSSRGWLGYCSIVLFPLREGWALFDTGHFCDRSLLLQVLKQVSLEPLDIRYIVVSHLHFDHILNIPLFKKASLLVSKAEMEYAIRVAAGEFDDPAVPENWRAILEEHEVRVVDGPMTLDERTELEVLAGHTPGGLVMYRRGAATLAICGDVIKNGWDVLNGEPTAAGVDLAAGRESIRHVLGKAEVIVPGHERPFTYQGGVLEFLSPFNWQVRGHLLPGTPNDILLNVSLPAGAVSDVRKTGPDGF